ncbi:hypothetical protein ACTML0_20435 [Escherichia coli]|uniref:hypothetical protein n=1 Tax=Escherichia coli TaxID=562 RepID=UPI0015F89D50|nr:hypothetical protein [Escherichia coli]MCB6155006.1 hypothetical protein [Escherichia coli]
MTFRAMSSFEGHRKSVSVRLKLNLIIELYNQAVIDFESGDNFSGLYLFRSCLRHSVELLNDPYSRLDSYEITVLTRYISLCNDFISRCKDIG